VYLYSTINKGLSAPKAEAEAEVEAELNFEFFELTIMLTDFCPLCSK